ncbi:ATP-binding protein [Actinocorallia aurea]
MTVGRWSRMFDGDAAELVNARRFVRDVAAGHEAGALYRAVLAMNEFATNAIQHTFSGLPGGRFVVEVERFDDSIMVGVIDFGAPTCPVAADWDDESEDGRGLAMVAKLADKWGVEDVRVGRRVWAVFPDDPGAVVGGV